MPQNILDGRLQLNGVEIIRDAGDMEVNEGACWPSSLRRKAQSEGLSMKRFSTRTAGARVWRRRYKSFSRSGSASV